MLVCVLSRKQLFDASVCRPSRERQRAASADRQIKMHACILVCVWERLDEVCEPVREITRVRVRVRPCVCV
jgi:hypothetical protein